MKLLMSEGGEIACERHAPFAGTDTFVLGRWRAMRTSERVDFHAEVGIAPSCTTCDAVARRHDEGAHARKRSDECALCAVQGRIAIVPRLIRSFARSPTPMAPELLASF